MDIKGKISRKFSHFPGFQVRRYSAPLEFEIPPSKQKYVPESGTYPKGFAVSGVHVGVKASNTNFPDIAIINSQEPCRAAAVFTRNSFQAAPIKVNQMILRGMEKSLPSLIINSGCANAVTGLQGFKDADAMSAEVDNYFKRVHEQTDQRQTLVMSTGVIGQRLPIDKILSGIPKACDALSSSHEAWMTAARAICTTDTFPKLMSCQFSLPSTGPSVQYSLAGIAKGAGMIKPRMATLLAVLCTDAPVHEHAMNICLKKAVAKSFNRISVDGDTSTNDTVALFANGAAAPSSANPIREDKNPDNLAFTEILSDFTRKLSHLVVRDGEGATKFAHVRAINSTSQNVAVATVRSVATSPLVKTALYGKDANWGRILCAIGANNFTEKHVQIERISVAFVPIADSPEASGGKLQLLKRGEPVEIDEERAARLLAEEDLEIEIDLGGEAKDGEKLFEADHWFCDYSHEYITINGDYRT